MVEKSSRLKNILSKLRKRHIVETLAAFIAGGWLLLEFVHWLLVDHYHFPEEAIDITFVTLVGALLCILLWRWFGGSEKRPGNIKVEVLLAPLLVIATVAIDLNIILKIFDIPGMALWIGAVAICLGIAWIILKLSQWASGMPSSSPGSIQKSTESSIPFSAVPEKSIAVLPFTDLSPQKDQEYFCDGMTEEIITDLSQIRELLVISRSSAMTFKGTQKKVREIAQDLNVRYVLEGSVRKAGDDLRIAAQLINASNDAHIWAEKYSGTLSDVFYIQEKVSSSIVKALSIQMNPEEERKIVQHPLENVRAYELHLKARYDLWLCTEEALDRGVQLVKNGLDIIGDNEALYADLGQLYLAYHDYAIRKEESLFVKADECIQKLFILNPDSAYGHSLRAALYRRRGKCQQAIKEWKRAFELDPSITDALGFMSWIYIHSGKGSAARPILGNILQSDPFSPLNHMMAGVLELMDGRFDDSLTELGKAYRMQKLSVWQYWVGKALAYGRRFEEATESFLEVKRIDTGSFWDKMAAFFMFALQGKKSEALQVVTDDFKKMAREDEMYPLWMAEGYALINEADEALSWLEHGRDWGFINYPFLQEYDPFLENLRGEPRFKKLMERVKHEWEHFEV